MSDPCPMEENVMLGKAQKTAENMPGALTADCRELVERAAVKMAMAAVFMV